MAPRRLQFLVALLLSILVAACGSNRESEATPTASPLATLDLGDADDGAAVGAPTAADVPTAVDNADAANDGAAEPAPGTGGTVSEEARGEVESRLRALGLTPPVGATLVAVDELDERDIDVDFLVSSMSPAELIDFYLTALPAAGYEISSQDDDEIEFRSDSASGELEVSDGDSGGTLLELDIEER